MRLLQQGTIDVQKTIPAGVVRHIVHMMPAIGSLTRFEEPHEALGKSGGITFSDQTVLNVLEAVSDVTHVDGHDRQVACHRLFDDGGRPSESLVHNRQSAALR